jgi:hypothetical protein
MRGSLLQCSYVSFGSEMPQTLRLPAGKSTHEHMDRIVPIVDYRGGAESYRASSSNRRVDSTGGQVWL